MVIILYLDLYVLYVRIEMEIGSFCEVGEKNDDIRFLRSENCLLKKNKLIK
jgi:hypothetical protein